MRILVIGASGTIGKAVVGLLSANHDIVGVGRTSGRYHVDIAAAETIAPMFEAIGAVDAVVCAAGQARFGPFTALKDDDFRVSLDSKLMGQVNLVRIGHRFVTDGGSFTLTSGILARRPMPGSAAISLVNAGLEGFARAAALELPRRLRINVVSPPWVAETLQALGMDTAQGLPADRVALAYRDSVESDRSGAVIEPAAG